MTAGVLDLFVNEGFVRMVDDSLVYTRGFGAAVLHSDVTRIRKRNYAPSGRIGSLR